MFATNTQLRNELDAMKAHVADLESQLTNQSELLATAQAERDSALQDVAAHVATIAERDATIATLQAEAAADAELLDAAAKREETLTAQINAGIAAGLASVGADPVQASGTPPPKKLFSEDMTAREKLAAVFAATVKL